MAGHYEHRGEAFTSQPDALHTPVSSPHLLRISPTKKCIDGIAELEEAGCNLHNVMWAVLGNQEGSDAPCPNL